MARTRTNELKSYVALEKKRRDLEDELTKVKAKIDELAPHILEWFQDSGIERTTVDGMTVYIRRELWAGRADGISNEELATALQGAGFGDYVVPRLNVQGLSAYVRELDREGETLPEPLSRVIKVSETFKVQARKGA